jgi:hypothetical protein
MMHKTIGLSHLREVRLRMFENWVLVKISGPNRKGGKRTLEMLNDEDLHHFYQILGWSKQGM